VRVLLDENMPHQLRLHLPDFDVSTAVYSGFGGFKNGELLNTASLVTQPTHNFRLSRYRTVTALQM